MLICTNCKKEMKCMKTGVGVRYGPNHTHTYSGDIFRCNECNNEIVNCNDRSYYSEKVQPNDILMDN